MIHTLALLSFILVPSKSMTSDETALPAEQIVPTATAPFTEDIFYRDLPESQTEKAKNRIAKLKKTFFKQETLTTSMMEIAVTLSAPPPHHCADIDLRLDILEWASTTLKAGNSQNFQHIADAAKSLFIPTLNSHQRISILKALIGVDNLPSIVTPFTHIFPQVPLRDDQYAGCLVAMKALPSASRSAEAAQVIASYFNAPQHLGLFQICEDHVTALTQVKNRDLIEILREANAHITPDKNGFERKKILLKVIKGEAFEEAAPQETPSLDAQS